MPETPDPSDLLLAAMEAVATEVALHTGIRQQYIDAGWSPPAAEQMTYLIVLRMSRA